MNLKKFLYILKVPPQESYQDWQEAFVDIVEAVDKKTVLDNLKKELDPHIAEKLTAKNKGVLNYRAFVVELSPHWEMHWLSERTCKQCSTAYTLLQKKQHGEYANYEYCSASCRNVSRKDTDFGAYANSYASSNFEPCIYKITNKQTNQVYIGQTIRCFTLRWYEHFFQSGDSKFHQAIKLSKPSDWIFEVLETLPIESTKEEINNREMHYINLYDSINNGYNTARFKND